MITTVKTGNERHEIYLNDEFAGWMFIPSKIDEYRFAPSNPISLDGDALFLIGRELNALNAAIKLASLAEIEQVVRLLK